MSASDYLPNLHRGPFVYRDAPAPIAWSLVIGTVQLFICGPGPKAWFACSRPDYRSASPGTPRERAIAKRAVLILIQRHREDKDAGVVHIQDALALATRQYLHAKASMDKSRNKKRSARL